MTRATRKSSLWQEAQKGLRQSIQLGTRGGAIPTAGSDWQNFLNWWDSSSSGAIKALLVLWIFLFMVNIAMYILKRQDATAFKVRRRGRILSVVGGSVTLISVMLPWVTFVSALNSSYTWYWDGLRFPGVVVVLLCGLLWFTCFALPKKVAAILGLAWGCLALLLTLLALGSVAVDASGAASYPYGLFYRIEYGMYASLAGSVVLIAGSTYAFRDLRKPTPFKPISRDMALHPIPRERSSEPMPGDSPSNPSEGSR